ncbi:MAG: Dam family site-specific DNA-(adenine-N6)-methyltransferase [Pedobacter sp.]
MHNFPISQNLVTSPFLKWVGGKRWLISKHCNIFPQKYSQYIEPFLGSGAVFFHLKPTTGILSDLNKELIDVYKAIKEGWREIDAILQDYQKNHNSEFYYNTRNNEVTSSPEKAARFIYLNRTCWNGLYRVNLNGKFNVPIGTKTKVILDNDNFAAIAAALENIELVHSDFEDTISYAKNDDFVFIDPPYTVKHNNNGFIKYNENLFSWDDQVRLRDSTANAIQRGAKVIITNAAHDSVEQLYTDKIFTISKFTRHSVLAGTIKDRKPCEELIICGNCGNI